MKKYQVLTVLYYDYPEIWRDITNHNYRHIRTEFGLNLYDTIDSRSIEDIVNSMHLELVNKVHRFRFPSPYDKSPPLEQFIKQGALDRILEYRVAIVQKVSAFTNTAVRRKVIDLYRRGRRQISLPEDEGGLYQENGPLFIDRDNFVNIVFAHREVEIIIKFLDDSSEFSEKEKAIFANKLTGHSAREIAQLNGVTHDNVNYTIRKIKKCIVHKLRSEGRI